MCASRLTQPFGDCALPDGEACHRTPDRDRVRFYRLIL
jgi:hypothetical protein